AGGCTQHCECSDDNHIDINIFGECIWHHCEPTEEDEDEGEYESSPPPDEECDDCDCSSDGPQQGSLKFRVKLVSRVTIRSRATSGSRLKLPCL
ncbi:MAG: hypothetical protein WC340_18605, partial [Kiritimatiellia bacterium]